LSDTAITATALTGIPEVRPGDDLAAIVADALADGRLHDDDVLVLAHKIVSKAEGQIIDLRTVHPGDRARELAAEHGKDARLVQVVLDQSAEIVRARPGVLICLSHHGFVCANAGVDASNVPGAETVVTLPRDPDASARRLRAALAQRTGARPAVLITDSFGRAWRHGQCDVTIGLAGLAPLEDWRGRQDAEGRELHATWIAVADELAGAADLARSKDGRQPVVLIGGAGRHVTSADGPGAAALLRPRAEDLFR
jgi:coenzyme F420-0:L-glutamate ligase/coenzyme F420-1:gamma-L-glutamate ligase